MSAFLLEGLDRLGKSSLATNIQKQLGFHQVLHFGKPLHCAPYVPRDMVASHALVLQEYQHASFSQMFKMLLQGHRLICDRSHLGEAVYANMYRGYSGDYVFGLEKQYHLDLADNVFLVLLVEDFATSKHFVDDGESFDITKREQEQGLFIAAFERSIIKNKKIVCVTDRKSGEFRFQADILNEVLS